MDISSQVGCLFAKGIISEDQHDYLQSVIPVLPTTVSGLLFFLASNVLYASEDEGFVKKNPVISSQQITSASTVDVKSLTVPSGAKRAIVTAYLNDIFYREDGTTPLVNNAHYVNKHYNFEISKLSEFKFVSTILGDATIFVSYY